jgi:hypothetical protein
MGLLDDAIRDHLELKRRRGADPTEMERLEREALGPVRRGPQEGGVDEPMASPYPDEALAEWSEEAEGAEPDAASAPADDEVEAEAPTNGDGGLFDHQADEPSPRSETPPPAPGARLEEPPAPPVEVASPAPEAASGPLPAAEDYLGQETAEYDVEAEHALEHENEHAPATAKETGEEDVLEETPEFLQDTPDHDRLWFEQRPPRDFDFDD